MPEQTSIKDRTVTADIYAVLEVLYRGLLDRSPDTAGAEHYIEQVSSGRCTLAEVAKSICSSPEFASRHGVAGDTLVSGCSASEAVNIFDKFTSTQTNGRPGFITNFLGGLTSVRFVGLDGLAGHVEGYPIPRNFHADTLEWVGTLQAVLDADGDFNMVELGAGWAPWCTIGYMAAKQRRLNPYVVAVEGDRGHVDFIEQSFQANEQEPTACRIVHGVVGTQDGTASFPRVKDASRAYGGAARYREGNTDDFDAFLRNETALIEEVETVPCFSLETLLADRAMWDLVHCDIQGAELDVIPDGIRTLNQRVKRVIVGTHSFRIDRELVSTFASNHWVCEGVVATKMVSADGAMSAISDGTQVWRNVSLTAAA